MKRRTALKVLKAWWAECPYKSWVFATRKDRRHKLPTLVEAYRIYLRRQDRHGWTER
jgi:hypothetical protein